MIDTAEELDQGLVRARLGGRWVLGNLPASMQRCIEDGLTFDNPKWAETKRMGFWTGKVPRKLQFFEHTAAGLATPRGLKVPVLAERFGVVLDLIDETTAPEVELQLAATLRPYQERAARELLEQPSGVLVAPTGSGKSVMGCALAARLGLRTLFLTHTAELVRQWRTNALKWLGMRAGVIGGGKWSEGEQITVGSIQTLAKPGRAGDLEPYGLVVVDECHHAPALTWAAVLDQIPACRRYGLSATPWRKDRLDFVLDMAFGSHRAIVSKDEVEAAGSIVPAEVIPVWTYCDPPADDWHALLGALAADQERNALIADIAQRAAVATPVLVLTDRIEHAEQLAELFGPGAVLLHGQLNRGDREAAMEAIHGGAKITVATSGILGEGVDVSGWGALVMGLPMGSKSPRVLQAVGRVVRPAPGKVRAQVFDLVDEHNHANGAWRGRRALYRRNGIEVQG